MVLDASALVAIILGEPGAPSLELAVERDDVRLVSAVSVVEAGIVVESRLGPEGARSLDRALAAMDASVVPVDAEHAREARLAWSDYGKGRHVAALDLGDCFTYALALVQGEPVLATGDEFIRAGLEQVSR
jgi:ribonuclease VapC